MSANLVHRPVFLVTSANYAAVLLSYEDGNITAPDRGTAISKSDAAAQSKTPIL